MQLMKIKVKVTKDVNASHLGVPLQEVLEIDIEEYLKGVVPSEIGVAS